MNDRSRGQGSWAIGREARARPMTMRALITGAGGQLGLELRRAAPDGVELLALERSRLDVTDAAAVRRVVTAFAPTVVLNAAAYTAVDRAEAESELAFAINERGARAVAAAATSAGARVIHVSTDFVFDGRSCRPYRPDDEPHPVSAYARSKLAGERAVLSTAGDQAVVVRTAWLYSSHGANFAKTILRLLTERDVVRVVADQIGTPTWALPLARALWSLAQRAELSGVLHWTDAGVASWYDFAVAIREEALAAGLLERAAPVLPIRTEDYPTPAQRPAYSVLDKTATWAALGLEPRHWRGELRAMLEELKTAARAVGAPPSHQPA